MDFNDNTILLVTNRSSHKVCYPIPETENSRWREFVPYETKKISYGEIEAACSQPGCKNLFDKYLLINEPEAVTKIMNKKMEPEYFFTPEKMKSWLPSCSLDELLDALDFAPEGVLSLIKAYSVSLPLNDMNKCQAIKEKLGFDVLRAIENNKLSQEQEKSKQENIKERRVVQNQEEKITTKRRVAVSDSN